MGIRNESSLHPSPCMQVAPGELQPCIFEYIYPVHPDLNPAPFTLHAGGPWQAAALHL